MAISFESKGQSHVYKFCLYSILHKIKKKTIVPVCWIVVCLFYFKVPRPEETK